MTHIFFTTVDVWISFTRNKLAISSNFIWCMRKQSPIFFPYRHKFFEIRLLFVIQRFFRAGFLKKAMSYLTCCPDAAACLWMCVSLGVVNTDFFFKAPKIILIEKNNFWARGQKKERKIYINSGWSFFFSYKNCERTLLSYIEGAATSVVRGLSPDVLVLLQKIKFWFSKTN